MALRHRIADRIESLAVLAETRSDRWCLVERSGLVSDLLGCDQLLLRHRHCLQEGLHRGLAEAPASLVRP
jgi:hypothetical protein